MQPLLPQSLPYFPPLQLVTDLFLFVCFASFASVLILLFSSLTKREQHPLTFQAAIMTTFMTACTYALLSLSWFDQTALWLQGSLPSLFIESGCRFFNFFLTTPLVLYQFLTVAELEPTLRRQKRNELFLSSCLLGFCFYIAYLVVSTQQVLFWSFSLLGLAFTTHVLFLGQQLLQKGKQTLRQQGKRLLTRVGYLFFSGLALFTLGFFLQFYASVSLELFFIAEISMTLGDALTKIFLPLFLFRALSLKEPNAA